MHTFITGMVYVTKRDGRRELFNDAKIHTRIVNVCEGYSYLNSLDQTTLSPDSIVIQVKDRIFNDITTPSIDQLVAQTCASKISQHPEFGRLASRMIVNNLHKETPSTLSECLVTLYENTDHHGRPTPLISEELYNIAIEHQDAIDKMIVGNRDYDLEYFGLMTLFKAYLLRINNKIVERPQYMWARVALGIHGADLDSVRRVYQSMSQKYYTHATPTLFHAGTPRPQLSSCFLMGTEDSVKSIYKTIGDCAMISKWAGGIGVHLSNVRARGSSIRSTGRVSDGIVPLMRVLNNTARYINQSGRRNGSFAIYLEPWHADIFAFLDAKKNRGNEEERARDLFYAMWVPDIFMQRVHEDKMWSLMCPDECPGLTDCYGEEFQTLYEKYETEHRYKRQVKARDVFKEIINSQIETGTPYMLYKDAANHKSNQKHLGTIKSSNLCAEIIEYSDDEEYAVCNLASIALQNFVVGDIYSKNSESRGSHHRLNDIQPTFDFELLEKKVDEIVNNIDIIIDRNFYPTPETEVSNKKHRPMGIGVQGLADTYIKMGLPFDSPEAIELNRNIFETIYYASLKASLRLAKTRGAHEGFADSPLAQGFFQFDLWRNHPVQVPLAFPVGQERGRYPWNELRAEIQQHGIRNSLLVALMPTASTSQILGSNECIEPFTSNIYVRRTLAGEFTVVNTYLIQELIHLGLWDNRVYEQIVAHRGSVQHIPNIPDFIKTKYKTAWEIKQKVLLEQSRDRGVFVCQSQSLNIFLSRPEFNTLYSIHMWGWKLGLKTGSYYLRTRPAVEMQAFTVDPSQTKGHESQDKTDQDDDPTHKSSKTGSQRKFVCTGENGCEMCGS